MKQKEILLFGASGQIGRNLIRKLSKNNYKIKAVTRNIHTSGYIIKTQANPGYLELVELNNFNPQKIEELIKNVSICINLIGILHERKKNQFENIHSELPDMLSKIANKCKLDQFIHLSSLGIEKANDSNYARSKLNGEKKIIKNFKNSVIIKPSIVYSVDDKFTTNFMTLLSRLPIMPLYYNGNTKFSPIHVSELVEIIINIIENKKQNLILECLGPETISFKDIIKKLLKAINKKRLLFPLPDTLAKISAKILQILPNPLLTEDQLKLLKHDNVKTGLYKTNFDINMKTKKKFDDEILKYSYNWKNGGQFSKSAENLKIK